MSLTIGFDASAFSALRAQRISSKAVALSTERLSSGRRINRASDDPAGLGISMRLRGQITGLQQAARNIGSGQAMLDVAEAGMSQISDVLQRVRELAVQWNSGTLGTAEKQAIQAEVVQLNNQVTSTISGTQFNGVSLLNAGGTIATLQVGPNTGNTLAITGPNMTTAVGTAISAFSTLATTGTADITAIDTAIGNVATQRAATGAFGSRLEHSLEYVNSSIESYMQAESRIADTDVAMEMMNLTAAQLRQDVSIAMLAQANQNRRNILALLGG